LQGPKQPEVHGAVTPTLAKHTCKQAIYQCATARREPFTASADAHRIGRTGRPQARRQTVNTRHLIAAAATVVMLAASAAPALAGGEPKNEWPFTRPVNDRAPAQIIALHTNEQPARGEAKNEFPFTRRAARPRKLAGYAHGGALNLAW
jgi:acyl-coenzyme A thioesterase PaaI-like protein